MLRNRHGPVKKARGRLERKQTGKKGNGDGGVALGTNPLPKKPGGD